MHFKTVTGKFLFIYVSFFLILSIVIVPLFNISYRSLEEQTLTSSLEMLQNGLAQFESELDNIYRVGTALFTSQTYGSLLSIKNNSFSPPANLVTVIKSFSSEFDSMSEMLTLSADFGFVFSNNLVFDAKRMYMPAQPFYGVYFETDQYASLQDWRKDILQNGTPNICAANVSLYSSQAAILGVGGMKEATRAVLVSLPLPLKGKARTFCFSVIPEAKLLNALIFNEDMIENSDLLLTNSNSVELLKWTCKRDGQAMTVTAQSVKYGMTAVMNIQTSYISAQLAPFIHLFILSMIIYVLVGVAIVIYYARKNARPVQDILNMAQQVLLSESAPNSEPTDAYQFMNRFITQVDTRLKENRLALYNQQMLFRENLLERLLRQQIFDPSTEELVNAYFQDMPLPCVMAIINSNLSSPKGQLPPTELASIQMRISQTAAKYLTGNTISHFTTGSLVILQSPADDLTERYTAIANELNAQPEFITHICLSLPFDSLDEIHNVFKRLQHLLRFPRTDTDVLIEARDTLSHSVQIHSANRFYEMLIRERLDAALQILNDDIGTLPRQNGEISVQQLFFCYRYSLCSLISYAQIDTTAVQLPVYNPALPIEELFESIRGCARELVRLLREKEEHSPQEEKMLQFIEDNLSDPMFGIERLTGEFSISDKTAQRLMRGAVGMTFFEYVHHRRMEKARCLLEESDMPIQEISAQCGYASLNTFYKAFQRTYSTTPNLMRKQYTDGAGASDGRE